MRIVCPNCRATYEVPETLVGTATRQVRCARCQTEWRPQQLDELPQEPAVERAFATIAEPFPKGVAGQAPRVAPPLPSTEWPGDAALPPPRLESAAKPRRRRGGSGVRVDVLAALVFSVVLLVAIAAAAYVWRDAVMQVWPASERVFALLDARLRAAR